VAFYQTEVPTGALLVMPFWIGFQYKFAQRIEGYLLLTANVMAAIFRTNCHIFGNVKEIFAPLCGPST
jgi:hypothetical protein